MLRRFWTNTVLLASVLAFTLGCPEPPPPGSDLVGVGCICTDNCAGGRNIPLGGDICTDASNPDNVTDAADFLCRSKETIGFNVCKIENCGVQFSSVTPGGCPADNGEYSTGDFGQAKASAAVPPSNVGVTGDDINAFTITPESLLIETTQTNSTLFFGSIRGSLGSTTFTSDGIFGDDEHTLADGQISGAPFSVELFPDGTFIVLPGVANFIATGVLDGDRLSLTLINFFLTGVYDEDAGVFTMSGVLAAVGADLSMSLNLVLQFENRPPRAAAGPDQVVECSSTALTGDTFLSGAASFDLDGDDDIDLFTWYVDNVETAEGEEVTVPILLGEHEVTLIVADLSGSFDGDTSMVLVEDTTPPTIVVSEPAAIEYPHSTTIVLDYEVGDGCTGVDSVTPLLDGVEMVGGHGLLSGQPINLLTELSLGEHTFVVDAVDNTGNGSWSAVMFVIVVTPESIQEAVQQFVSTGAIARKNGQFLLNRLVAAARAYRAENCNAAVGVYNSFIQTIKAQNGKSIDPEAAAILIADAQFLIDNCPVLFAQNGT
jgi:hypothetical protein